MLAERQDAPWVRQVAKAHRQHVDVYRRHVQHMYDRRLLVAESENCVVSGGVTVTGDSKA